MLCIFCCACNAKWDFSSRTEKWKEDIVLHDGRLIKVEREADKSAEFHFFDPFFGLLPYPRVVDYGIR